MSTSGSPSRVVVIGSTPIALGVARGLSARGATVATIGRESRAFDSEASVRAALAGADASLGGIDQVVHAWVPDALLVDAELMTIDEDAWAAGCERGLEAAWWVARQAIPPLVRSKGSLVFLVPTIGMAGAAGFTMLATVAEGIRVLAKGCGRQLGAEGVTVNTIATAPHLWVGAEDAAALTRSTTLSTPAFGGPGDAATDIAPIVAMLASPDAHFLTAATLATDGGTWMGL
jgi:NAD(P)-dependent dehydrogenase (short-subunit alcohol dehydrogenase family)